SVSNPPSERALAAEQPARRAVGENRDLGRMSIVVSRKGPACDQWNAQGVKVGAVHPQEIRCALRLRRIAGNGQREADAAVAKRQEVGNGGRLHAGRAAEGFRQKRGLAERRFGGLGIVVRGSQRDGGNVLGREAHRHGAKIPEAANKHGRARNHGGRQAGKRLVPVAQIDVRVVAATILKRSPSGNRAKPEQETNCNCEGFGTGNGAYRSRSRNVNMAMFSPIPSARMRIAAAVEAFAFIRTRTAYRTSRKRTRQSAFAGVVSDAAWARFSPKPAGHRGRFAVG